MNFERPILEDDKLTAENVKRELDKLNYSNDFSDEEFYGYATLEKIIKIG